MIAFIFSALNSKRVINNIFITLNHFASLSAISAFSDAENERFIKAGTENDLFRGANNKVCSSFNGSNGQFNCRFNRRSILQSAKRTMIVEVIIKELCEKVEKKENESRRYEKLRESISNEKP